MKTPDSTRREARAAGPAPLTPEETERYRRHLVLPGVGPEGQLRLKGASILLVGAGGLGAPAGLYLAAAGVGRLALVDDDRVDASNLQRQVLFNTADVGRSKVEAARETLHALNPNVEIVTHPVRFDRSNAVDLIRGHDLVVDGSDNFATRYLINDACVQLGVPFVSGSVSRFAGQVSLFVPHDGPCYRCLFPEAPDPGSAPDCADGGVLGVLPGIVGSIQAAEALKWLLETGSSLRGRLLRIDALTMKFSEIAVARDPACPVCGDHPSVREHADGSSRAPARKEANVSNSDMTVTELKRRLDAGEELLIVDVREPHEHQFCNIGGVLIPFGEIPARMHELDADREMVVYCRTGSRSSRVVDFLRDSGFGKVWNLKGGIHAWAEEIDPTLPRY